jgi:hypothetical protein
MHNLADTLLVVAPQSMLLLKFGWLREIGLAALAAVK